MSSVPMSTGSRTVSSHRSQTVQRFNREAVFPSLGEDWEALETGRRWRLGGAGDWEALEIGGRWRLGGAGDWGALETGRRWRLGDAGDWETLETGRRCDRY
jgi:hypothetical protein